MHELSLALAIVDIAAEEAGRRGGRVAAVHLKLGRFSGVVEEALRSAYELAREGTPLAESELIIEEVPLVIHCAACDANTTPSWSAGVPPAGTDEAAGTAALRQHSMLALCCPTCGAPAVEVVSGRELEVFALEIEP